MIISEFPHLDKSQTQFVLSLVQEAQVFDSQSPLSEHVLLHLKHGGDQHSRHLIAMEDEKLVGYVHLDLTDQVAGPSAQVVVHPESRNLGYGKQLLQKALDIAGGKLRLWSHGENTLARNLAQSVGMKEVRNLLQMRRSLLSAIDVPIFPAEFTIHTFNPDTDTTSWLQANTKIFQQHPEQGQWQLRDVEIRIQEDWFNPQGFFLLKHGDDIAGFSWTKVHSHSHGHDHIPLGEIYVLGVSPEFQGRGLAKALTLHSLQFLRSEGLLEAMLYVNKDDTAALSLYESCGFRAWDVDTLYSF
ncbi:MAG: mycothiol synthase [Actinomycetota bacterium]